MSTAVQVRRLVELGVPELAGVGAAEFTGYADGLPEAADALVVVHPSLVAPSRLAGRLCRDGKPGFVVVDLADLDEFAPIDGVPVPDRPLYFVYGVERGDEMGNWSPNEALPAITGRGRSPLTVGEGISWLLQEPGRLERNRCFMTIGSRRGGDARTPAIWISNGTGRDGRANRGAPKVGWCWAGNRHTWLGFASASGRSPA